MKKVLALLLAALLLLSCAACGEQKAEPTTEPTTQATEPTTEATEPTTEATDLTQATGDQEATFVQLSISEEDMSYVSITAYDEGEGKAYVEYAAKDERKVGHMDLTTLNTIADAVESSKLMELKDQSVYEDGMASASMYVSYADESFLTADFTGAIPQEFRDGYAEVEAVVRQLMADIPVYVPRPMVEGEPNAEALQEMEAILDASGAEPLDMYMISEVPMDDSFTAMMGLSKTDGITAGLSCAPMMSAVAFSCSIATADGEASVDAIADDFAANIQWDRWICVSATDAMIATKGNQVLCLVTTGDLYTQISTAATASGWTVVETLTH